MKLDLDKQTLLKIACVLGFMGEQLFGISPSELKGHTEIYSVLVKENQDIFKKLRRKQVEIYNRNDACFDVADGCKSLESRKARLARYLKSFGIELKFVK